MLVDRYTKIVLTVIAAALVVQTGKDLVSPARADDAVRVDIVKLGGKQFFSGTMNASLPVKVTGGR